MEDLDATSIKSTKTVNKPRKGQIDINNQNTMFNKSNYGI